MKIYKISQIQKLQDNSENPSFSVWLAKELSTPPNNASVYPTLYIKLLQKWVNETNPNLNNYNLKEAYMKSKYHYFSDKNHLDKTISQGITLTEENKKDIAESLTNYLINYLREIETMSKRKDIGDVNPNTIKLIESTVGNTNNGEQFRRITITFDNPDPNFPGYSHEADLITKDGKIFLIDNIYFLVK